MLHDRRSTIRLRLHEKRENVRENFLDACLELSDEIKLQELKSDKLSELEIASEESTLRRILADENLLDEYGY